MENQAPHAQQIQAKTSEKLEVDHELEDNQDNHRPLNQRDLRGSSNNSNGQSSEGPEEDAKVVIQDATDKDAEAEPKGNNGGYGYYVRLWSYGTWLDVLLRICGFLAACAAGAALPLMTVVFGRLVNDFNTFDIETAEELRESVDTNVLYFVYLFIAKFLLVYLHTSVFTITATRATRKIRHDYISCLLRQDISYFDTCTPGSVATSISNNADIIQNGMADKVGTIFQGLAMLVAAYVVALSQGWKLALVTATTMPAAIIGVGITLTLDARLEAKILDIYSKAGGLVEEALGSIRVVAAFGAQSKLIKKYDAYLEKAKVFGVKKGPILGILYSSEFFTMYCAYALAFWYGIRLLLAGDIGDGGTVVTVLLSIVIGTSALTMIAPALTEVAKAGAAAKALLDVIDRQLNIDPVGSGGEQPESVVGAFSFKDVSFAYPARPGVRVLDRVSLEFEPRKVTAIVGASGSGKSTIVGLAERWYDPLEGRVLLDGKDIKDLKVRWLRSQIGLVQQEPVLFNDTIYNNVVHGLYGTKQDALPENEKRKLVQQACEEANAHSFIQDFAEGYDTKVGERAGFISGGQKQRIAIARSIISNPRILLLDEATSALDPKAEGIVQSALDKVSKTRTTLMIAHKLSTVKKADKIIVMNQGRVVEQGSPQELLAAGGAYSRLVNAQNLEAASDDDDDNENKLTEPDGETDETQETVGLSKTQTTKSVASVKSALKQEDVSRKFSLFRCILIIFYEQRRFWHLLTGGLLFSVAAGAVFPAQAVLFSRSVTAFQLPLSEIEEEGNFWALMFFVVAIGTMIAYASLGFLLTVSAFLITRNYRSSYFGAMLRQDISFYDLDSNASGALTARLSTDPQRLQDLISANIGLIVIVIVNLLSCSILALVVGWKLALVGIFGALPPLFFAGFARMRIEMRSQDRNAAMFQESARFASEAVGAIRTVSSLAMEGKIMDSYGSRLDRSVRIAYKHTAKSMCLFGLSDSLDLAVLALTFWYGGQLLADGEYNTRDFFLIFIALVFGGQAAGFLFGFTLNTTKAHAAANQILHLRDQKPPINSSGGKDFSQLTSRTDPAQPIIDFRNVQFAYPTRPELPILRKINLQIQQGQTVGIVGASGCGKTTIITLLERFYDITSGQILIHGEPLTSIDVASYRANIGLVSQDTTLYQGTLRENILLGEDDAEISEATNSSTDDKNDTPRKANDVESTAGEKTAEPSHSDEKAMKLARFEDLESRLIRACKAANIHDFILSLPEGYNTQAGSRGLALSGGQRQRIAIARALVRNPSILLLDEATSALDTQSEEVVQRALETAAQDRTVVAVAHRLSTVRNADCIFVLERGVVVESGTHVELSRKRGKYWEMVQAQSLDREAA